MFFRNRIVNISLITLSGILLSLLLLVSSGFASEYSKAMSTISPLKPANKPIAVQGSLSSGDQYKGFVNKISGMKKRAKNNAYFNKKTVAKTRKNLNLRLENLLAAINKRRMDGKTTINNVSTARLNSLYAAIEKDKENSLLAANNKLNAATKEAKDKRDADKSSIKSSFLEKVRTLKDRNKTRKSKMEKYKNILKKIKNRKSTSTTKIKIKKYRSKIKKISKSINKAKIKVSKLKIDYISDKDKINSVFIEESEDATRVFNEEQEIINTKYDDDRADAKTTVDQETTAAIDNLNARYNNEIKVRSNLKKQSFSVLKQLSEKPTPQINNIICLSKCGDSNAVIPGSKVKIVGKNINFSTGLAIKSSGKSKSLSVKRKKKTSSSIIVSIPKIKLPKDKIVSTTVYLKGDKNKKSNSINFSVDNRIKAVFPVVGSFSFGSSGSRFGASRSDHIHQGQDISAGCGQKLVAVKEGKIIRSAYEAGGAGNYIVIKNKDSDTSFVYMHMIKKSPKRVGSRVKSGTIVGKVGNTGSSFGCHLHFEYWKGGWHKGGKPVDPLNYLKSLN